MIELDIRRCKPDSNGKATWVVSHNDSLKNTMGVNVDISDSTYSELLKYSYTKGNNVDAYSNLKKYPAPGCGWTCNRYLFKCGDSGNSSGPGITWAGICYLFQCVFGSTSDSNLDTLQIYALLSI